jgi:hypothetical protein
MSASSRQTSPLSLSSAPLIIIDVENVRGKSAFQWSHEALVVACGVAFQVAFVQYIYYMYEPQKYDWMRGMRRFLMIMVWGTTCMR